MTYLQSLGIFWVLIFGIIVIPGMDMLLVLSNTMARGLKSGFAALSGIIAGGAVHTIWGLLSVALILRLPPMLIPVMLTAGALYLAWIGWTLLNSAITVGEDAPDPSRRAFRQGLVTCLLNPKAWVFVVSVFPQFVRPEFGPLWQQGVIAGLLVALTQLAVYGGIALAAGRVRRWMIRSPKATIWTGRITGAAFLIAAALTLWAALG